MANDDRDPRVDPRPGDEYRTSDGHEIHVFLRTSGEVEFYSIPDGIPPTFVRSLKSFCAWCKDAEVTRRGND